MKDGCELADQLDVPVYLYRLKLAARGTGLVGEMTSLIGDAFSILHAQAWKARTSRGISSAYVLVVDEADALAQSREAQQMHHEDRAGVDALLAGVDGLAGARVPVLVVLCTNRERALDPAVMRRAAATFQFDRPTPEQRHAVLADALDGFGVSSRVLEQLVVATGEQGNRPGYTYSDLTQRLIPTAVLAAFPDGPVSGELLLRVAQHTAPTPVFSDGKE